MIPPPPPGFQLDTPASGSVTSPPPGFTLDSNEPSMLQKIAQLSAVPRNGLRGLAVGAENLIEGHGLQPSLQAASDATQQSYKSKDGEKIANIVANGLDPRLLATGLIAAPAGAGLAMRAAAPIVQGAVAGGTANALSGLENTGKTSAGDVATGAAIGAATGGISTAAGKLIAAAPAALKSAAINLVRATGGVRPGAVQAYMENPSAVKAALGTEASQRATAQTLQNTVENRMSQLGQDVAQAKGQLGVTSPSEINDLPTVKQAAQDLLSSPPPVDQAGQLDRIRAISSLKDQIHEQQSNLFNNGNADVLTKRINPNAEAGELRALYGKLNEQLKGIPAAKPLVDANAAFSPAQTAYDDVVQKQFGGPVGRAQSRLFSLGSADPGSAPEAMAPDVQNAINKIGGDVPSAYAAAKAEATKRALSLPNSRILNNPIRTVPGMVARAALPTTIDLTSALHGAVNPTAQAVGQALQSPVGRLSLIQALMQAKNEK